MGGGLGVGEAGEVEELDRGALAGRQRRDRRADAGGRRVGVERGVEVLGRCGDAVVVARSAGARARVRSA